MKNLDWKDVAIYTALLIGLTVEILLAVSAVIFVLYEVWHFLSTLIAWVVDNLPDDAIPFMFLLIIAIGVGWICLEEFGGKEPEKEDAYEREYTESKIGRW